MSRSYVNIGGKAIRVLLIPLILIVSSCAAPTISDLAPNQFGALESSSLIESESEFLESVAGKQLKLLNDSIQASLVFNKDGTAAGSLVRDGEDAVAMDLDWVWVNASYCRTGTIGNSEIERKCESVRLFPDVGILLRYIDVDDPEEYWLFEL